MQPFQPSSLQEITAELQEVKRLVLEVASQQARPAKAIEKRSYAATAATGNKAKTTTPLPLPQPIPAKQTAKQRKQEQEQRQLVLVTTQEEEIDPLQQRNAINAALQSNLGGNPVIASVSYSVKKNLILTIINEYNADFLLQHSNL